MNLDETDLNILKELIQDSRLSVRELSARVHRSSTPVFERLKRLENENIIKQYTVVVDEDAVGRGFTVFCNVSLKHISAEIHREFAEAVAGMSEVVECYNVSGAFDYMLKVQVPDMKTYRRFVTDKLGRLMVLDSVQSVFVMEEIKRESGSLPLIDIAK